MDWRLGEKYFANNLTDYDPCVNNGNWQWIASTGVDPNPYFQRLFKLFESPNTENKRPSKTNNRNRRILRKQGCIESNS